VKPLLLFLAIFASLQAQTSTALITPKLDHWEIIGDGRWVVMQDGTLIGYRHPNADSLFPAPGATISKQQFDGWKNAQSWLYTRKDFAEYDLHVEYWITAPGNSGISIRDPSRARYGVVIPPDYRQTPSKLGYEIQIASQYNDPNPSGSIYTLARAKTGLQRDLEWNAMDIESRANLIRVKLNGQLAAEHSGDPKRPKTGPVGLQLHDQFSTVLFRNIRIREIGAAAR
jgi:hypothetical protein